MRVDVGAVRSSILAFVRQNKFNSLIYSLLVPLLVGIWSNFYTPPTEVNPLLFWAPVTEFVIFACHMRHKSAPHDARAGPPGERAAAKYLQTKTR